MFKWFKTLFRIVRDYDKLAEQVKMNTDQNRITKTRTEHAVNLADESRRLIKERTTVHADVHRRHNTPNQIITIGHYRGQDYVQCFSVVDRDFTELMYRLKDMEKYGVVEKVDAWPQFSAVIKDDLKNNNPWSF